MKRALGKGLSKAVDADTGGNMKTKVLYDLNEGCGGGGCPKFVHDVLKDEVTLVDKQGGKAVLTVAEFNRFAMAFRSGVLAPVTLKVARRK